MNGVALPHLGSAFVDEQGRPTRVFATWLRRIDQISTGEPVATDPALATEVEALARLLGSPDGTVAGIPTGFLPDTTTIRGGDGIDVLGQLRDGVITIASETTSAYADVMSRISMRF